MISPVGRIIGRLGPLQNCSREVIDANIV